MKKSTIFIVVAFLCLKFNAQSQTKNSTASFQDTQRPAQLELGAVLPEKFWTEEHTFYQNGIQSKKNLFAYKSKIVILDFWASWCGSCIRKLPLLDSIQKIYPEDILALPINTKSAHDQMKNIENVFNGKRKPFRTYAMPTVLDDTVMRKMFPHHILSHVVWIQDGKVLATTSGDFISAEFIDHLVNEQRIYNARLKSKQ